MKPRLSYFFAALTISMLFFLSSCTNYLANNDCIFAARIIDGDTFILQTDEKVRLIGIDTPEKKERYYFEATQELTSLISGKCLRLEKDISDKDEYGRLLRYVYVDNNFINEMMVEKGFAESFPFFPDVKYASKFEKVQLYAKKNKLGMWSD